MNWIDILILVPLLIGLVRGVMNGFVKEGVSIIGVIIPFLFAKKYAPQVVPWFTSHFGGYTEVNKVIAYVLIFLCGAILLQILGRLITRILNATMLEWLNKLFGAILGTLKSLLIVMIVIFCINTLESVIQIIPAKDKKESFMYEPLARLVNKCWDDAMK